MEELKEVRQKVNQIMEQGCAHRIGDLEFIREFKKGAEFRLNKLENRFFWIMALLVGNFLGIVLNLLIKK